MDQEKPESQVHKSLTKYKGHSKKGIKKERQENWSRNSPIKAKGINIDTTGINIKFDRRDIGIIIPKTFPNTIKLPQNAA